MGKALHRGAEDLQKGGRVSSRRQNQRQNPCYPQTARVRAGTCPLSYILRVSRFAIDVTACWRPQRVGMLTVAVELSRALVSRRSGDEFVLLCSRERPSSLAELDCEAILAPYRHELVLKSGWLPTVESQL